MRRFLESIRNAAGSAWSAMLHDEGYARRMREMHEFLTHPELGRFRRAYVKFFAGQIRTDSQIHVDFKDERRFTEALKRRHGQSEEQIQDALKSMETRFFESYPERYTLFPPHIEALRQAEKIRMALEKTESDEKGN